MELDRRVRMLEQFRRRIGGGVAQMSLEDIQTNRRSRLPEIPGLEGVAQRVGRMLFGEPRAEVRIDERRIHGPAGEIPLRRYTPPATGADTPLVIYLHGGGWVLGSPAQYDWLCSSIAADLGAVVVSVQYRLAPEHPAPAARQDCIAAVAWLAEHAAALGAPGRIAVGGDSAGGNLSALVAIHARDLGAPDIAAQVLIYPAVDLTRSFPSHRELADAPILPAEDIAAFLGHYLDASGRSHDDPELSPWHVEDLSGVAPALVQTAEHDPLRDEGRAYADALAAADVPVRWTEYVGVPHGFISLPGVCPVAHQAVAEMVQFLDEQLRPPAALH